LSLSWELIEAAQERLNGVAIRTPVLRSRQFDELAGCEVFFKAENFQRGGAFKFRGAYNKIRGEMDAGSRVPAVVAFSSGNHAQAVALTSRLLAIPAVIVMPTDAPQTKVDATRSYGAEIVFYDRYAEDREVIGRRIASERQAMLVPPFDDFLIMAGQGTACCELLVETGDLDVLVAPVSGGGLMAGCATAARHLQQGIRLYGVEPEAGNDTYLSFEKGERVTIPVPRTIADGLQLASPGALTFPILQRLLSGILLVSDAEMIQTMRFLLERMKILVEPSGAAAAAAVLFRKHADFAGKRVGVILSGGNIGLPKLKEFC
jgi:threonine dehydratase